VAAVASRAVCRPPPRFDLQALVQLRFEATGSSRPASEAIPSRRFLARLDHRG